MADERRFTVFADKGAAPIKAWIDGVEFEDAARKQVEAVARMPFIHSHVAVMPDVHSGKGATIGTVIATSGAIIPAAVGVDIGCGMIAARTTLNASDLPDDLSGLRLAIEEAVPHGRSDNGQSNDVGSWRESLPERVTDAWTGLAEDYSAIVARNPKAGHGRPLEQLGTLGTGNHFLELCLDEEQRVWIMLHSGSRGPGASIGNHFIELAKRDMKRYFINLPDADLAYLVAGSENYGAYRHAVAWAQRYARTSRALMMQSAYVALKASTQLPAFELTEEGVNCHHNYVDEERHFGKDVLVTRKGAVRARTGDLGIIPGSMGARSFIVEGLGNRESFHTCSHGAGRRMSRTAAKNAYSADDLAAMTSGVECRKTDEFVDEIPAAYKSIDAVIAAQSDLIRVRHTLKQVLCVKGA